MKKVRKPLYCRRCGDQISPEEQALLSGSDCAFCSMMQLEAVQIQTSKHKAFKAAVVKIVDAPLNLQ